MNRIEKLEEQLALGEISDSDLDKLFSWYKDDGYRLWQTMIYEKDKKKRAVYQQKIDRFELKDTNFLKAYLDFLIFKHEQEQPVSDDSFDLPDAQEGLQEEA